MKILTVTTAFPRWRDDGHGAFVWELCRAIAQKGHIVEVVAMHAPGALRSEIWDGVRIRRLQYWLPARNQILRKEGGGIPTAWQKYRIAKPQIVSLLSVYAMFLLSKAHNFDIIHAHWTLSAASAIPAASIHRRPLLVTTQGSDILTFAQRGAIPRILTRVTLSRCTYTVALSRHLAQKVIELGIPSDKVDVIPNGVDTEFFAPSTRREDIILFAGSLIERKGLRYLLEAFESVCHLLPSFKLVVVGEGPLLPTYQRWVESRGLRDRVLFLGELPHSEVRNWMQIAKLFVLPSTEEGLGVVLLESLACGTPVLASSVNGIVDIVDSNVGALVKPRSSQQLAEGMIALLGDRDKWFELSVNARARAEEFDRKRVAEAYILRYKKLCQQ
ncbi:MAG: glycosyltransferase [Anaerolineae bacterium]|nr:glycosyltransferase [Anaerolineae bacterium]